jgi:uncharacterized repeat protein (TIGR02543 family)
LIHFHGGRCIALRKGKDSKIMRVFKKFSAVVLSAALVFGSSLTAFAADPTTTAGTGNILDYKIVSEVVPTALKVAINPNGYPVNLRYAKLADDATYNASTKYYKEKSGGGYEVDTSVTSENFASKKASLYTATTSDAQIVSFNYGLVNKSTVDRKITVKLAVTADENIEFVSTAAKATKEATEDDGGAKKGEYKIFLQLVPAKASSTLTANTYVKATAYDGDKTYYTKSGTTYTEATVADEDAFKAGTFYEETTTIGTEILNSELGDVTMQPSTAPIAFVANTGSTSADVAYVLDEAEYTLKPDEFIDFDTATGDVEGKFDLTGIGGLSGFTFAGVMNTNAEWSQLTTKTITITPTYKFEDATGFETAVNTGLNQVETSPDSYIVTYNANFGDTPATATESVAADAHPTGTSEAIAALKTGNTGYTFVGWGAATDSTTAVDLDEISAATTLYAIWEAEAPATYALTKQQNGNLTYSFSQNSITPPAGTLESVKVNNVGRAGKITSGDIAYNDTNGFFKITAACVTDLGITEGATTVIAVIGGEEYTFTY